MPPKKPRGLAVLGAGLARRFSRSALTFLLWWGVVGSSPLFLAATFTTAVTISESDTTYDGQDIVVNGATLTVNGAHSFASLLLTNAAVLTHSPCTATATHKLEINVVGTITVSANSKIDVSGFGYLAGRTSGNTTVGGAAGNTGGSYGGRGGSDNGRENAVYGDYTNPIDWGSGGGGTAGGGLVRITAGQLNLDGQILANGVSGSAPGSGGGIYLAVQSISGSGTIRAGGPIGGSGASGGGGRVAVWAGDFTNFDTNHITAPSDGNRGGGTVYLRNPGSPFGTLILNGGAAGNSWTPLGVPGTNYLAIPDAVLIRGSNTYVVAQHAGLVLDSECDHHRKRWTA